MKKIIKIISSILMVLSLSSPVYGITKLTNNTSLYYMREQLLQDIALIESVDISDLKEFQNDNKKWIEDVNSRLENYISLVSDSKYMRTTILKNLISESINKYLLEDDNYMSSRSVSDYFNYNIYHFRNGYWTYSLQPKSSTRLLRYVAIEGWEELKGIYYAISIDGGSLYNQYMCHFDLVVEEDWDIERGRPHVLYFLTVLALCNPE